MLENYLLKIGFTVDQISFLNNSYKLRNLSESNILNNYKKTCSLLHKYNLDNKEIINITMIIPDILYSSYDLLKNNIDGLIKYGFNKLEISSLIVNYPYIITSLSNKINNIFSFFKCYNLKNNHIKRIIISNPYIIKKDNNIIKNNIDIFVDKGYKIDEIMNLYLNTTYIFDVSSKQLNDIFNYYNNIGLNNIEIINLTKYYPNLLLIDDNKIKDIFLNMEKYGFTKKYIVDILKKIPILLKNSYLNNIYNKLSLLENLLFTKSDIVSIIYKNPYVLLHSNNYLSSSYNTYFKICDDSGIVNDIIINEPILLGYNQKVIIDRIKFFKKNNLISELINNPVFLTYSIDYLNKRKKIIANIDDFFLSDKDFFEKYNKTHLDIIRELN